MENLGNLIKEFKAFINTNEGREWTNERKERRKFYAELMSEEHIKNLAEDEFKKVIKSLWAFNFWHNKDLKVSKILEENGGVERIREELHSLLYGEEPLGERYDNFRRKIRGIGPSMITELIAFADPQKYCIWNQVTKTVLPFLGMKNLLPDKVFKYEISGKEYKKCINVLSKLRDELKVAMTNPDFIDVDCFLWFVYEKTVNKKFIFEEPNLETESTKVSYVSEVSDHVTAQRTLVELGNLLGYDTYIPPEDKSKINIATLEEIPVFISPEILETVKHIDVIWFREEFPVYCFEVEDSTDVTKGLLRLYLMRYLMIVPIIVGPESKRAKFKVEVEKSPFKSIRSRYRFISYDELSELIEVTRRFTEIKLRLLGERV